MSYRIDDLLEIMRLLRDPQQGCPWDLQQDFCTIAPYTIEEAYEVADAIQRENLPDLKDELGDLLFQVVFHARMAEERGAFGFEDVVEATCEKMVRRHPHVFAADAQTHTLTSEDVSQQWNLIKADERSGQEPAGILDGIPRGMAELQRAVKLQKKAATAGFDWTSADQVLDKLHEETRELEEALEHQQTEQIEEELGDLFFTLVNLARKAGVDPASALRQANAKFEDRFRQVEQTAGGKEAMLCMNLDELEMIWQSVKSRQQQVPQKKHADE